MSDSLKYSSESDDNGRTSKKNRNNIKEKDLPLFDLDFSGRNISATKTSRGVDDRSPKEHHDSLDSAIDNVLVGEQDDDEKRSYSSGEEDEQSSENDATPNLEKALFDEWDLMAFERSRQAVDDGYGYYGDVLDEDLYNKFKGGKLGMGDPNLLPRLWETSLFFLAVQNIENKAQFFFYAITFGHVNKNRKVTGIMRRRVLYTTGLYLHPGEYRVFNVPLIVWPQKTLPVSYKDLVNYSVTIDLWNINPHTFNTLYASTSFTLQDIVDAESTNQITLQRKLANKKRHYEIQRIKIHSQMSEIFEFDMFFESWSFIPNNDYALRYVKYPKFIKFILPKGVNQAWKTRWTEGSISGFWKSPLTFVYQGTMQSLQNAYFIAKVYVKTEGKLFFFDYKLLGTSLMSLHSVTTYSLFRSMVKKLTLHEEEFNQGEIMGNVRCFIRSVGIPYYEDASFTKRPVQPLAGAALVTQLDYREQFLVVRLMRCESLPAANYDAGTSDPIVKIKWDGMTNSSTTQMGTVRPVWNQNFYFPIRLLDALERTSPAYIKHCLPVDLLSKGNIIFECWDQDETSSDYLGGCEVHLSCLLMEGKLKLRCLAEGLKEDVFSGARMADGKPVAFQYTGEDAEPVDVAVRQLVQEQPQIYEIPYLTHVYHADGVELTGSTIATSTTAKPSIFFDIFCIPPLPEGLHLPAPVPIKEKQDLWKQWSKRWDRDFNMWQRIYLEWFPMAPRNRRFTCIAEHPQTRHLYPLPAFVVPIAVPEQLSDEGELLHWITNMTFIISTNQYRTGHFPRWLSPNYFLITRKGGVNDHAVLLCSCLLGLNYNAYVCKGTINEGKDEHSWVMTRHEDGWILFWETTTKKRYHLPARLNYPSHPFTCYGDVRNATVAPNQEASSPSESYYEGDVLRSWYMRAAYECGVQLTEESIIKDVELFEDDVIPDVRLENLDIGRRGLTAKAPEKRKLQSKKKLDIEEVHKWMESQLDAIPIAPRRNLLNLDSTLVYVPYSSIEVVFNHKQLWGNLQNHHPAVIYYDLENTYLWRPFLTQPPTPIDNFILIAPSTQDKSCNMHSVEIQVEVAESIRVVRSRKGFETQVDHSEEKAERIDKYLDLLEFRVRLDPDCDPGPPENHMAWSAWGAHGAVEQMYDTSTAWYSHLHRDPADISLYGWENDEKKQEEHGKEEREPMGKQFNISGLQCRDEYNVDRRLPQQLHVLAPSSSVAPPNTILQETPEPLFQTTPVHAHEYNASPLCHSSSDIHKYSYGEPTGINTIRNTKKERARVTKASSPDLCSMTIDETNNQGHYVTGYLANDTSMMSVYSADFFPPCNEAKTFNKVYQTHNFNVSPYDIECFDDVLLPSCDSSSDISDASGTDEENMSSLLEYCKNKNIKLARSLPHSDHESYTNEHGSFSSVMNESSIGHHFSFPPGYRASTLISCDDSFRAPLSPSSSSISSYDSYASLPSISSVALSSPSKQAAKDQLLVNHPFRSCTEEEVPTYTKKIVKSSHYNVREPQFASKERLFQPCLEHNMIMDDYESFFDRQLEQSNDADVAKNKPTKTTADGYTDVATPVKGYNGTVVENQAYYGDFPFNYRQDADEQKPDNTRIDAIPSVHDHITKQENQNIIPPSEHVNHVTYTDDNLERVEQQNAAPHNFVSSNSEYLNKVRPPMIFKRPVIKSTYHADQHAKWNYYYRMESVYYEWQKVRFPVKPSQTFCGFPIHFSTTDFTDIRTYLLSSKRFRQTIEIPLDGITYFIRCKVYPLMGGVVSCWLFVGCEIPWTGKQERQTRMKAVKKRKKKRV